MPSVDSALGAFLLFTLVLFRVSAMMLTAPVLGSRALPVQLKLGLAMLLTLAILPILDRASLVLPSSLSVYLLAVAAETAVGLILGFVASFLFAAVELAGQLIDQDLGLTIANVIDPLSNEQVSIVGQLKLLIATLLFLGIDAHHVLLSAVADSFRMVPVLEFRANATLAITVSDTLVSELLDLGVRLAAPTMVSMMLTTVALGFLARAVPEMNIFVVGFSIRLMVGFLILALGIGGFAGVFAGLADDMAGLLPRMAAVMR